METDKSMMELEMELLIKQNEILKKENEKLKDDNEKWKWRFISMKNAKYKYASKNFKHIYELFGR